MASSLLIAPFHRPMFTVPPMLTIVERPLLKRALMLLCGIAFGVWMGGCTTGESSASGVGLSPPTNYTDSLGTRTIYMYAPDHDQECLTAEPRPEWLAPALAVEVVLDSLGSALSRSYFYEWNEEPTGIAFETIEVERLPTPPDSMRLAVVNMVDPDGWAERGFFQGTTGGSMSQLMISATFIQAALTLDEAPLLDGLVLLYNGERISPMDHTRLDLIQQPEDVIVCSP